VANIRSPRKFTDAFKAKVLSEVASGRSVAEVTRQYNLGKNAIYEWQSSVAARDAVVCVPQSELTELKRSLSISKAWWDASVWRTAF
jgi:transposase-like protein